MSPATRTGRPKIVISKAELAAHTAALQMLYAIELSQQDAREVEAWYIQAHPLPPSVREQAGAMLDAAVTERGRIEALVQDHSKQWRLERMSTVDRSLIKLAVAEMLTSDPKDDPRLLQKALGQCKRFSQPGAEKFVHAILDAVRNEIRTGQAGIHA